MQMLIAVLKWLVSILSLVFCHFRHAFLQNLSQNSGIKMKKLSFLKHNEVSVVWMQPSCSFWWNPSWCWRCMGRISESGPSDGVGCVSQQRGTVLEKQGFGQTQDVQVGVEWPAQTLQHHDGNHDGGEIALQLDLMKKRARIDAGYYYYCY